MMNVSLYFPATILLILCYVVIILCDMYLQVQVLSNPSKDEFCRIIESYKPNIVYLQGERLQNDEVGSLVWGGVDLSTVEAISGLFSSPLPTTVCSTSFLNF